MGALTLPNTLTTVSDCAFRACSGLTSLTLPDALTTIGDHAFDRCRGLTSLTLPDALTTVGNSVFRACIGLTSLSLPHSLVNVRHKAFGSCTRLTSVVFRPRVSGVSGAFIAWAVGSSRNRTNWHLTVVKRLRNLLRRITVLALEPRDISTVDP